MYLPTETGALRRLYLAVGEFLDTPVGTAATEAFQRVIEAYDLVGQVPVEDDRRAAVAVAESAPWAGTDADS